MKLHRVARVLAAVVALSWIGIAAAGCIAHLKADPNATVQGTTDSYVIMGAKPGNYVFWITPVVIEGDRYDTPSSVAMPPPLWKSGGVGYPDQGYVVVKAQGGATLALTAIQYENSTGLPSPLMHACTAHVFTIPPGKIVYVGDIVARTSSSQFSAVSHTWNAAAARDFVSRRYPGLISSFEEGSVRVMKSVADCPRR